jgi:methylenetetrahydrofolate reductase (NADPH)
MLALRHWSVRHARGLRRVYEFFSRLAPVFAPLVRLVGTKRAEVVLHPVERMAKGFMFDCRECGQCVLSATGMACPMNCAKEMRNGPCGGVRADGRCEVLPEMRCVWVKAYERSDRLPLWRGHIDNLRPPVDNSLEGTSAWVNLVSGRDKETPPGWEAQRAHASH